MSFKKLMPYFIVGAIAIAGVLGVSAFQTVAAQATNPTPAAPSTQTNPANPANPGNPPQDWGGKGGFHGGASDQELATALGIDLTKLQAAQKSAEADALKQAVSSGLITQAQADEITARGGHFGDLGRFGQTAANSIDFNSLLAKALGISVDQLKAGYAKAYSTAVDNAVTNGRMTQDQANLAKGRYALENNSKYQSSMHSAYQAAVKQAVTDGVLTQAQADQLLKNAPTFGMGGRGFGGPGGRGEGHMGRGFGGQRPGATQPAAPTTPGTTAQ